MAKKDYIRTPFNDKRVVDDSVKVASALFVPAFSEVDELSLLDNPEESGAVAAKDGKLWLYWGGEWLPVGSESAVPAWTVYGSVPFGKYSHGMQVPAADSQNAQIKEAYQNVPHPSYSQPQANMSATPAGSSYEVGTTLNPVTIDPSFTQNDAGAMTGLSITKKIGAGAEVEVSQADPYIENNLVLGVDAVTFKATYSYAQGPVKNNEVGEADPVGQIGAGTKSAQVTYTPRYKLFYGAVDETAPITSVLIRGLASRWESDGSTFTLNTGTTYKRYIVAVRVATGRQIQAAIDLDAFSATVMQGYIDGLQIMDVADAAGNLVSYRVYVFTAGAAYSSNHRHQITI